MGKKEILYRACVFSFRIMLEGISEILSFHYSVQFSSSNGFFFSFILDQCIFVVVVVVVVVVMSYKVLSISE